LLRSFFNLLKKDLATALSNQVTRRLMPGTSWLYLHRRLNTPITPIESGDTQTEAGVDTDRYAFVCAAAMPHE